MDDIQEKKRQAQKTAEKPQIIHPPILLLRPSLPSINPQMSLDSQASVLSSDRSTLFSQASSLGFLPSLSTFFPDGTNCTTVGAPMNHRCIATIRSDRGTHISSLTVVGDYLYASAGSSIGSRNSIRVWQKVSLKECGDFGSGYGAVKALVVAGDRILSAHQDLKIRIWSRAKTSSATRRRPEQVAEGDSYLRQGLLQEVDASAPRSALDNSHKLLASLPTVKDYLKSFIPSKNYVQVRRHHKRLWIEHVDTISMLAVGGTAADPVLYSASWDRTIKVWKLSDYKCVESFKAHDDAISALLVAPEGFLYTASADAKVKVWGIPGMSNREMQPQKKKHLLVASLEAHRSAINALALSIGGERSRTTLYSAGSDRAIIVWEREESAQHMVAAGLLRGHRHAVLCLASTGNVLCSGSADHTIRVWHRSPHWTVGGGLGHSCIALLQGHKGPIKCLSLTCDGGAGDYLLYSSSLDHDIKLWQLSGGVSDGCNPKDEAEMSSTQIVHESFSSPWKFLSI